jgi:branched-subunit amino acid ABC-type transport system permease component
MEPNTILIIILNGLYYAFALFLISIGLNVLYGVMRVLNIGHGAFYAMGAFFTWFLMNVAEKAGYPMIIVWLCIPAGAFLVGITAFVVEPLLFKKLYTLQEEYSLLATFGLLVMLDDILRMVFGGDPLSANQLFAYMGVVKIFGKSFPGYNFVIYVAAIVVALGLWAFIYRTKLGTTLRGASQDRDMARSLGVNTSILYTQTFFIAIFIAGLGGAIYLPATSAYSGMGFEAIVLSFAVMIIGGLGSLRGALAASLLIGIIRAFGIALIPRLELAFVFVILIATLVFRPRGLFGKKFTREEK